MLRNMIYYFLLLIIGLSVGFYLGKIYFKNKISNRFGEHRLLVPKTLTEQSSKTTQQLPISDKQLSFELAIRKIYTLEENFDPQGYIVWKLFRDVLLNPGDHALPDGTIASGLFSFSWSYEEEYLKISPIPGIQKDLSKIVLAYWESPEEMANFKINFIPPQQLSGIPSTPLTKEATYYPNGNYLVLSFKEVNFKDNYVYIFLDTKN